MRNRPPHSLCATWSRGCSVVAALLLLSAVFGLQAQTLSSVPDARYARLARGVNLSGWFQFGGYNPVTAKDRDLLKSAGFTSVRLPVAPENLLPSLATPPQIQTTLKNLDSAIDLFVSSGMAVMLCFQADANATYPALGGAYFPYLLSNPTGLSELIGLWRTLSQRYGNRDPNLLFFEIMNEPTNEFTQQKWDSMQTQILAAIRQAAPAHTVLLSPVDWSQLSGLVQMQPYQDGNVIYVLHYYESHTFTHQGASWVGYPLSALRNIAYPSYLPAVQTAISSSSDAAVKSVLQTYQQQDWQAAQIDWDLGIAAAWAKANGTRVVINEFGVYRAFAPADSRYLWLHDFRVAAEKHAIGWEMWNYAEDFPLVNTDASGNRTIDLGVAAALGLAPWTTPYPARPGPIPAFTGPRVIQIGAGNATGGGVEALALADLNGDGLPDLVQAQANYPSTPSLPIQLFVNIQNGVFQARPDLIEGAVPTVQWASMIATGHFNKTGRPGFFFPDRGPTDGSGAQSRLLLPQADGKYADATAYLPQEKLQTPAAAAGDVDGDGVDDLVVFHYRGASRGVMELWRNDGAGHFRVDSAALPSLFTDPTRGENPVCGVFVARSGGGVPDLLVFGYPGVQARVLTNDGSGRFSVGANLPAPRAVVNGPIGGSCAATADVNHDGLQDVIVGFDGPSKGTPDYVQILINNGDGTFHDETDPRITQLPATQTELRSVLAFPQSAGKTNGLLLIRVGGSPVIKVDRGDGVFLDSSGSPTNAPAWDLVAADLNGDGLTDLLYGSYSSNALQAQFGQAALTADGATPVPLNVPVVDRVTDGANYGAAVSPGSWLSVSGRNLMPPGQVARIWAAGDFQGSQLPTSLNGVSVTVDAKPAAIYYVSASQLNIQVPDTATRGYVAVQVSHSGGVATGSVLMQSASPVLFQVAQGAKGQLYPAATAADGTLICDPAVLSGSRPARPGETIVLYGTGFGATSPAEPAGIVIANPALLAQPVSATLGGETAIVAYAGLISPGLDQINVQVPSGLASGQYPLALNVNGMLTQANVWLVVGN